MRTVTVTAGRQAGPHLPKRLLALAGDERLVEQIRRGNEAAFAVAFERHSGPILSFCRHMLGSREEAEDAVQQTFAAAYSNLVEDGERKIRLKPWLYAIARNRCLSVLRARREQASDELEIETAGLQEQVQRRAELRDVLRDLGDLPEEQREALLLAELGDFSHAEIAGVLDCEVPRVKALVFRARSGLMERREARDTPCAEVREQLANLRGGSLRRTEIKHHLRVCEGCREYRAEVRRQRTLLAAALPAIPSTGFKGGVLGAILGYGGGSAGGGAAVAGGSPALAKLALAGVLVSGGAVAGTTALQHGGTGGRHSSPAERPAASNSSSRAVNAVGASTPVAGARRTRHGRHSPARRRHRARHHSGLVAGGAPAAAPNAAPARGNSGNAPGHARKVKKPKKVKSHPPRAHPHIQPPKANGPPATAPPQSAPPRRKVKGKDSPDQPPAAELKQEGQDG